jgi:hypothetical protein
MEFLFATWIFNLIAFFHIILALFSILRLFKNKWGAFRNTIFLILICSVPILGSIIFLLYKKWNN